MACEEDLIARCRASAAGTAPSQASHRLVDPDLAGDRRFVRAGQRVTRGQVIGLMGDTGSPGAVHLHFEYWRSGGESDAVDPAPLLRSIC